MSSLEHGVLHAPGVGDKPSKSTHACVFLQTDKGCPHPSIQLDPGSQTARPQVRNSASGCNAAPSLHQSIGSTI